MAVQQNALPKLGVLPKVIEGLGDDHVLDFASRAADTLALLVHPDRVNGQSSPAALLVSELTSALRKTSVAAERRNLDAAYQYLADRNAQLSQASSRIESVVRASRQVMNYLLSNHDSRSLMGLSAELDLIAIGASRSDVAIGAKGEGPPGQCDWAETAFEEEGKKAGAASGQGRTGTT